MRSSLPKAFVYAFAGIIDSLQRERNMRIHWAVMMMTLLLELVIRPRLMPSVLVISAGALVIALELVNTAIESAVDLSVGDAWTTLAKRAKDAAAGAVLIAAVCSVGVGVAMLASAYPWHWYAWRPVHPAAAWLNAAAWLASAATAITAVVKKVPGDSPVGGQ